MYEYMHALLSILPFSRLHVGVHVVNIHSYIHTYSKANAYNGCNEYSSTVLTLPSDPNSIWTTTTAFKFNNYNRLYIYDMWINCLLDSMADLIGVCGCGRNLFRGHDSGRQLGRFGGLVVSLHHFIHLLKRMGYHTYSAPLTPLYRRSNTVSKHVCVPHLHRRLVIRS